MKHKLMLFTVLSIAIIAKGQMIKIQAGPAISQLKWQLKGIDAEFFPQVLTSWAFLAGVDYMERRYFNLSSNIGMIRKGGRDEIMVTDPNGNHTGEYITSKPHLDYLTVNTCIDFMLKKKLKPFIGIGPRFDYLLSYSKEFDKLDTLKDLRHTSFGLLLGTGLKYDVSRLQFGLRADYYLDFTKVADWPAESNRFGGRISVKTLTVNVSIGYKLK